MEKDKRIRKEQLLSLLGFLHYQDLTAVRERFKRLKVEDLTKEIIKSFYLLTPEICLGCHKIYHPTHINIGDDYYVCEYCPRNLKVDGYKQYFFPICGRCVGSNRGRTIYRPHTPPLRIKFPKTY